MSRIPDETLMAFADGELGEAERASIAAELEHDAESRAAVEEFRRAAMLARAAVVETMSDPIPQGIIQTVLGPQARGFRVVEPGARRRRASVRNIALPLAACLAVAVALGAVWFGLRSPTASLARGIELGPANAALARLLETRPSGTPEPIEGHGGDSARIMAVATFQDRNGRYCREIELLGPSLEPLAAGVACRDGEQRRWTVEGMVAIATPKPPGGGGYAPSGAAEKDALAGLMSILGATSALSPEQERSLLDKAWK